MDDADGVLDSVNHVLAAVRRAEAHVPRRGHVSCHIARLHKKARAAASTKLKMTQRVQEIVRKYNADHAKTESDILDLEALQAGCQPGRPVGRPRRGEKRKSGAYKQWVPAALARVCWGYRKQAQKPSRRLRQKTSVKSNKKSGKTASPNIASAREWARHMRCSHTHVNRVRHAVAELFMRVQEDALFKLPWVKEQWVEFALDETQEPVQIRTRGEQVQVMVVHMRIFRLPARARSSQQPGNLSMEQLTVVLPTVLLEGTTTEDLYAGLMKRLPLNLIRLSAKASSTVFFLNTDSFGSCLRLRRCLAAEVPCLGCPCRMHQLCIALTASLACSGSMSSLYCGSLLLRRARYQDLLRKRLKAYIAENLTIAYEEPTRQERLHAHAVWNLHWPLIVQGHEQSAMIRTKRAQAWQRLKNWLLPAGLKHFCPFGCHASKEAIVDDIYQDLCTLFLDSPPAIPAWNKWTKIAPVLCWFAPLLCLGNLFPALAGPIFAVGHDDVTDVPWDSSTIKDEDMWKKEEFARVKKFHRFLLAKATPHKLVATLLSMQPTLKILGQFFSTATGGSASVWAAMGSARLGDTPEAMVLLLAMPSKSPVIKTIKEMCARLLDHQHDCWDALSVEMTWDTNMCLLASVPVWIQIGQLHTRLVLPFQQWPWKFGQLLEGDLDEQTYLAKEFLTLCRHRDPIISYLRQGLRTVADVLHPNFLEKIRRLLTVAPMTNMVSEKSFARSHVRRQTTFGNEPKQFLLAAQHVLDESKSILDCALRSPSAAASSVPLPARIPRRTDGWTCFLASQRKLGAHMRGASELWGRMSFEDKEAWRQRSLQERAHTLQPVEDPVPRRVGVSPVDVWPGCGDKDYPLRPDAMKDVSEHVKGWADAWRNRVEEYPCTPMQLPSFQHSETCKGPGCMQRLDQELQAKMEKRRKHLNRWAAMTKAKPPEPKEMWSQLPFFFLGTQNEEVPFRGVWLLQICALHDGQVYCAKFVSKRPCVSDVVDLSPSMENLMSQQQVVDIWAEWEDAGAGPVDCLKAVYTYQSMVQFEILEMDSLFQMEKDVAEARRKDPSLQKILSVTKGFSEQALLKEPRKRHRKKAPATADTSEVEVPVDAESFLEDWDEELDLAASPEAGHAEEVVELEVSRMMDVPSQDVDDMAEERSCHADASGSRPLRVDRTAVSEEKDTAAQVEAEHFALKQEADGRIYRTDVEPRSCIGRITLLRVGEPQEAFSVYCSLHGCQIMRRINRIPSSDKLLAWFHQGLHLPRGRDLGLQAKHKNTFPGPDES